MRAWRKTVDGVRAFSEIHETSYRSKSKGVSVLQALPRDWRLIRNTRVEVVVQSARFHCKCHLANFHKLVGTAR